MNQNKQILNIFYGFFLLLLIIEGIFIYSSNNYNKDFSVILIVELIMIYLVSLLYSYKWYGIGSVFTLFLLCLGLFNFQKFFWDSLLDNDFRKATSLIVINLHEVVVQKTVFIFCVFTLTISWTYFSLTLKKRNKRINFNSLVVHNIHMYKVGSYIFYIFLPLVLYKSYLEFIALFGKSYTEFYTEDSAVDTPFYLRLALLIFQVGFMLVLSSVPKLKNFYIISAFYFLTMIPYLLIGLRANFAVSLLCIFWYYTNVLNGKVNLKKVVPLLLGILIIFQVISVSRNNSKVESNYLMLIPNFLYEQSQTMYVLSLYIQYEDDIISNTRPYILDPLTSWMYDNGQSVDVATNRSSLGHSLAYSLSPDYYFSGSSLGTNFIAELYEYGISMIFFGAISFAFFIIYFENKVFKSRVIFFLSFVILQYFFLAPRSSFLPNVYLIFKLLLIYSIIIFLTRLNIRKKKLA